MYTNPLIQQSITSMDVSQDLRDIRRLLTAAAISRDFCNSLLSDPGKTVHQGFGGERFFLSEPTLNALTSVQAVTLPEFIHRLDEKLSNGLLRGETFKADR